MIGAATLLVLVAFTTVITTAGDTAGSFGASVDWQTWALSGMSLGLAGTLLSAGALADIAGHRRVFVLSSLGLAAASALAALAPAMLVFVLARVLQGAAGGGILAAGLGLVGAAFPDGRARTRATGIWGAALAGGIALGPLLAAIAPGWRGAYWVEAVAAVAVAGAGARLPASAARRRRQLDLPGALTMLVAMTSLTAGLTAGRASWTAAPALLLLAAGIAALAAFIRIERHRAEPLLDLALLRRPLFVLSLSGAAATGLGTIGLMSYAPTLLERGLERSALAAGGVLAIWSLTSMLVSTQAGRLPERVHSRERLAAGLLASAAGLAALAWLGSGSSAWALAPGLVVAGVGSGLANAALARLAVESVPRASAALGSGANNTARYLGSALGIALVVAIVSAGGDGRAGLVEGWDHAAVAGALVNVAGAALAVAGSRRRASLSTR